MSSQRTFRPGTITLLLKYLALFATVWGARVWLIQFYSSALPFWDQWDEASRFIKPWLDGALPWAAWFEAHNEHRILCTRVLDVALLALNGQWDQQLQMVVNAAIAATLACLFVGYCVRFCGTRFANLFFALIGLLFALPFAAENTLAGFQSQVYFLILFSTLTIFALGFHRPGSAWWMCGIVFSIISLFTMGSGLFASGVVVLLILLRILRSPNERGVSLPTLAVALPVTIAGALLRVSVEDRLHQHAASLPAFFLALGKNLAWPFIDHPWTISLTFLPIFVVGIFYWRRKLNNSSAAEFALAIGFWVMIQAAAMAYGRGGFGRPPTGRYMDVLALGPIANWIAVVVVLRSLRCSRQWQRFVLLLLGLTWLTTIAFGCVRLTEQTFGFVRDKKVDNLIEEENVKGFLATSDEHYIIGKPELEIPFPPDRATELITLLKDPTIRSILPVGFSQTQPMGKLSCLNSKLLRRGWLILFLGLLTFAAAGIPDLLRLISRFRPARIADVIAGIALIPSFLFVWSLRNVDERMFTAAYEKWIAARAYSMQDFSASVAHGFGALSRKPDDPETLNKLALALIAPDDVSQRKSGKAVELAERACSLSGERSFEYLETLGMAYAESDRFDDAARVTKEALGLASVSGNLEATQRLRIKMERYSSHSRQPQPR